MTEPTTISKNQLDENCALLDALTEALAEKVTMRVGLPAFGMFYERTGQRLQVTVSFDMFEQLEYLQPPVHRPIDALTLAGH